MSGSSTRVNQDGTIYYRTEYEPLGGQEVYAFEPQAEFPEPLSLGQQLFNADDVMWQCSMLDAAGRYIALPTRCALTALADLDLKVVSIAGTADVIYTYDALGNRKQMTDGTGTTTYAYNQLLQMTSETRTITELSSSYTVNYEYNLSGGLRSISDPFEVNRKFVYSHDKLGRVTGTAETAQNVTHQYIYNTEYRAWGAMKKYRYDDATSSFINPVDISFSYDAGLRVSEYDLKNSQGVGGMEFQRHADGKLYYAQEKSYPNGAGARRWLDRSYGYDQVGRLKYALSGYDANEIPGTTAGPYKQLFTYNAFSEVTQITGKHWDVPLSNYTRSYDGSGRDSATTYDAAGNIKEDQIKKPPNVLYRTLTYDAAGRQVHTYDPPFYSSDVARTSSYTYDGNGWQVKDERLTGTTPERFYKIRSTVLGGEEVGSIRIYNSIIQFSSSVPTHDGKIIHSYLEGGSTIYQWTAPEGLRGYGGALQGQELDPRGADAGLSAESGNFTGGGSGYPGSSDAGNYARCAWEGMPMPCDKFSRLTNDPGYRNSFIAWKDSRAAGPAGAKPSSATAHASLHNSSSAQASNSTTKPADNPQAGSTILASATPDEGYVNLEKQVVTIFAGQEAIEASWSGDIDVPIPVPKDIKDRIKDRLGQGDCNAFIAKLITAASRNSFRRTKEGKFEIQKLATPDEAYSADGAGLVDQIKEYSDVSTVYEGEIASGGISGSIGEGNAKVLLRRESMILPTSKPNQKVQAAYYRYVSKSIHEMIHHGRKGLTFSDHELAYAAYELGETEGEIVSRELGAKRLPSFPKDDRGWSYIWDKALGKHCGWVMK